METYALDFETYYDKSCSIRTLGPLGYFSHPDFDAYMISVVGDDGYKFVGHPKDFDWSILQSKIVLSHNASFDETLYLYGVTQDWWPEVTPAHWYCTADMAAACGLPRSLKNATAQAYDLEISKTTRDNMSGKRWENMSEEFQKEVSEYALKDSELCLKLWQDYSPKWSQFERDISRMNRTMVQRGLPIDTDLLEANLQTLRKKLFECEHSIPWASDKPLLSRKAFDEECIKHGIEPPASLAQTDTDAQDWIRRHGHKYRWIEGVTNWRRINALMKKLESFDYATMPDGRYYGGVMYFGGHTGRFSGSGGNLNLQNLPRDEMFGANLRHMIAAPEGRKLVMVDLSNIEVRTLCYLAKDKETLKEIAETDDIYEAFAVRFGLWPKDSDKPLKSDPKLRHKVKALVLGCFSADTEVLTDRGWLPIVEVRDTDKVWDGNQWVKHEGLLHQGVREVVEHCGVAATPEHEILTEHGWQEWSNLLQSEKGMKSALNIATLPSLIMSTTSKTRGSLGGTHSSDVPAGGRGLLTATISKVVKRIDATSAQKSKPQRRGWREMVTQLLCQTKNTVRGYSTELARSITDVITPMTKVTSDMGDVGYGYMSLGSTTDPRSSSISSRWRDGINHTLSWIGSITTKVMNLITSDSLPAKKTATISEQSPISKKESSLLKRKCVVYDLKNCGPNNRFTIKTNDGPIIVHNCGYGAGAAKFSQIFDMPIEEAEESVKLYRSRLKKIPRYWRELSDDVRTAYDLGVPYQLELPSGRILDYGKIKGASATVNGRKTIQHTAIMNRNGKRLPMKLWGGILAENASQAMARDIMCHMMLEIEKAGIRIILHVHDEVVVECDESDAEDVLATMTRIMSTAPEWCSDLPLDAEGGISQHYKK